MTSYDRITDGGGDTRTALLDAAEATFARDGFRGASVRAITRVAKANLGAITYHFGSKAALFEAVVVRAMTGLADAVAAAAASPGSPADRLERVVRSHFGYLNDHPDFRRLILQVLLMEGAAPPPAALGLLRQVIGTVAGIIQAGQAAGQFRGGDPRLLTVAVMAQPIMLNTVRPLLRTGPQLDLDDPAVRARVLDNAIAFIRAGLARGSEA